MDDGGAAARGHGLRGRPHALETEKLGTFLGGLGRSGRRNRIGAGGLLRVTRNRLARLLGAGHVGNGGPGALLLLGGGRFRRNVDEGKAIAARNRNRRSRTKKGNDLRRGLAVVVAKAELSAEVVAKGEHLAVVAEDQGVIASTGDLDDLLIGEVEHESWGIAVVDVAEAELALGILAERVQMAFFGEDEGVVRATGDLGDGLF